MSECTCQYVNDQGDRIGPCAVHFPKFGQRVEDGGLMGTIVRCEMCGGTGEMHQVDAGELARLEATPDED